MRDDLVLRVCLELIEPVLVARRLRWLFALFIAVEAYFKAVWAYSGYGLHPTCLVQKVSQCL